jgi:hypothetical protein
MAMTECIFGIEGILNRAFRILFTEGMGFACCAVTVWATW